MKVSTERALDRWAGVPACAFLTLHRRIFSSHAPPGEPRRILFVKLAEQGSTVLAAEAIALAIEMVGAANVFFLAFEENRFVVDAMRMIPHENVLTVDVRTHFTMARSVMSVLRRLREVKADVAIDLEFFARSSAIFTYLSGAASRVGLHSFAGEGPYRGDLMTHRVSFNPHVHTTELFVLLVRALRQPPGRFPAFDDTRPQPSGWLPRYEPSADSVQSVRRLLGDRTGPFILLNANCSDIMPLRMWPPERYVELAHRLLAARPEVHVVFTGAPNERESVEALAAQIGSPRCVSLAGRTTFEQLLALYSLSHVLVTNDSGPAHFASLTDIRTVTLFGPETPALFAARTSRNQVLWAATPCSPCLSAFNNRLSRCRDNVCMQRISIDQVLEAALDAYARRCADEEAR